MADDHTQYIPKPPKQVSDQVAAIDAMITGSQKPADGGSETHPSQVGSPSEDGAGTATHPVADQQPPPFDPRFPSPPPTPTQAAVQPGGSDGGDESWERRFKSLQGRHESIQQSYRQANERLSQMENMLALMQAGGAQAPMGESPPAELRPASLLSEDEVNEYGKDFLDVIGKRSQEVLSPELQAINLKLKSIEGRIEGTTQVLQKNQRKDMLDHLTSRIPNWRDVNRSQDFKDWVDQVDPFSGRPRREMLMDAFSRHDTPRVVNFFSGFLTEATGIPPNGSSPGNGAPPLSGNGNGSGQPSLEQFAAPGRARSAPAGELPPDKPLYTSATIAKFYGDKLRGLWKGREADAAAIEADIFRAQREGRVQL